MEIISKPNKEGKIEKIISEMKVGEKGYIYAGAIAFDFQLNAYLNLKAKVSKRKNRDPDKIPIIRTGISNLDYTINTKKTNYTWETEKNPFFSNYDLDEIDAVRIQYNKRPNNKVRTSKNLRKRSLYYRLNEDLQRAVLNEEYELASEIRDNLKKRK